MKVLCGKLANVSGPAVAPCVKCKHVYRHAKINEGGGYRLAARCCFSGRCLPGVRRFAGNGF